MLALLSPAKKMNFETPDTNLSGGEPLFHKEAYQLAKHLNYKTKLMVKIGRAHV